MRDGLPLLGVSMGDPVGIGPEVILKAMQIEALHASLCGVIFGDAGVLRRAAQAFGLSTDIQVIAHPRDALNLQPGRQIGVVNVSDLGPGAAWGRPNPSTEWAQVAYIRAALASVVHQEVDALVTAPITKTALSRVGKRVRPPSADEVVAHEEAAWPGHTEMLAELTGAATPVMMLAGPHLKVVPLTIHVALKDVPALITPDALARVAHIVSRDFQRYFGGQKPRIAVAALNPHAGEEGLFGTEDRDIIRPAVVALAAQGLFISGPFAADTLFHRAASGEFDVVIGMYHDQVLIPVKLLDFDSAVNVTLGLPIIRTSVDHGTGYDIAGKGVASSGSLTAALHLAAQMVQSDRRT